MSLINQTAVVGSCAHRKSVTSGLKASGFPGPREELRPRGGEHVAQARAQAVRPAVLFLPWSQRNKFGFGRFSIDRFTQEKR